MISVSAKIDLKPLTRFVSDLEKKQVPFATAKTLTDLAKNTEKETYAQMRSVWDRPTPFVMRGLRTKPATKRDLTAQVFVKDWSPGGKNTRGLADIIGHQFAGGSRQRKALEYHFERAGLISAGEYLAPGEGARLDQYGNLSRGQTQQIMSQMRVGLDPYSWSTKSTRSRRNVKKAGAMFWSRGGRLPRGVWMRAGAGVKPILIVISRPNYRQTINLQRNADMVTRRDAQALFSKNMQTALRTMR